MKIRDLLAKESIHIGVSATSKDDIITKAVAAMAQSGAITDAAAYQKAIYAREAEGSTGVGMGIAIPHGKGDFVAKPALVAMTIPAGVAYDSLDGAPVNLLFMIAAPNTADNIHLDVLAKLSGYLIDERFVAALAAAPDADAFLAVLDAVDAKEAAKAVAAEQAAAAVAAVEEAAAPALLQGLQIVAVTSCPTGIAHTYMAAESLNKAAAKLGCTVKVETRGSGGAKNVLTDAEIAAAHCVIVAADAQVPMARFHGKHLIECHVADGIHKAEELMEQATKQDAPVYQASAEAQTAAVKSSGSIGHKIYTQLMNGVSHMLPFVVGGGILIALAFLIDGMMVDLNALPEEMRANFGSITPIAATLKEIGGIAFGFMLPVLAAYIAMSIGDRPALTLGFVGGMIAASGQSGFLGALLAGFLAGYVILLLRKLTDKLPQSIEKISPVLIYPLFGTLIVGLLMLFVVEPVMGGVNTAVNTGLASMAGTSKILLGALLGGMMAIDMGGPFNKAAYVFGTAAIVSGNYDIMAAVMIGGMVPPCAIALSTILSKKKYTKEEREAGPVNFLMGLAFITEGAIPYAAADPLHVLPACIISSSLAGALSMFFGATLMAPHGGIFVFPVVGNALMYLLALVVSTILGAVLLGAFKKNVEE